MPFPLVLPAAKIFSVLIGAKLTVLAFSVITAPTNKGTREMLIEHAEEVIEGLDTAGIGIGSSDRTSVQEDILLLRRGLEIGWHEDYESLALFRLMKFLSVAHAKSTSYGASSFASSHASAIGGWAWKTGSNAFDSIFRPRA